MKWIKENENEEEISDLNLTFSTEISSHFSNLNQKTTLEFFPFGSKILLTKKNKFFFQKLFFNYFCENSFCLQKNAFIGGFYEILPLYLIQIFSEEEIEFFLVGNSNEKIDLNDWKFHSKFLNFTSDDDQLLSWSVLFFY